MTALDAHAHELVGLALRRLAQDHPDGDLAMFSALLRAWLGWAGEHALRGAASGSCSRRRRTSWRRSGSGPCGLMGWRSARQAAP